MEIDEPFPFDFDILNNLTKFSLFGLWAAELATMQTYFAVRTAGFLPRLCTRVLPNRSLRRSKPSCGQRGVCCSSQETVQKPIETSSAGEGKPQQRNGGLPGAPTFQEAISRLQDYWASVGCAVWLPHNTEVLVKGKSIFDLCIGLGYQVLNPVLYSIDGMQCPIFSIVNESSSMGSTSTHGISFTPCIDLNINFPNMISTAGKECQRALLEIQGRIRLPIMCGGVWKGTEPILM